MEVKNCKSDCHRACKVALEELNNTFSYVEPFYASGRLEQAAFYLEKVSSKLDSLKFDLLLSCDECTDAIDYILLLLTLISTFFKKLEILKKQGLPLEVKCRDENSIGLREIIAGFRRMLTEKDTILFIAKSLCHSSKFVRYKASKLFLLYFEEFPYVLAGQMESIRLIIYECVRSKSATVLWLLNDALKLSRRKLQRISLDYELMLESDLSTQLILLTILLGICNNVLAGKYHDPCDCLECRSPQSTVRIKAMYQAEKLREYILNANFGNKEQEKGSGLFQLEQLNDLLEHLKCFLAMFSLDLRALFAEVKSDSYALLYKLKLLLLKIKNDIKLSNDSNLLAVEVLTHFIHNAHIIEHFDFMKSYGFGGSSIATSLGNGFSITKEYTQPTRSLKLLVLVFLKCILYTCGVDGPSSLEAMMELGNRALNCISTMLESASSRFADEPVADKFCDYLVKVMMDDDDQLIRSVETLLCIYRKNSKLCNDYKVENGKRRILNEDFPHSLFHCLLSEISFDHMVCIDWLISDETCFESVLYQYLDIIIYDFNSFLQSLNRIDILKNNDADRRQNEIAPKNLLAKETSCFTPNACNARCVDCIPFATRAGAQQALKLSMFGLEAGKNVNMEDGFEGELAVNESSSGDEWLLRYAPHQQQHALAIHEDVQPTKTDLARGILPMRPASFPSLVDYSSSDNDDDLGYSQCNTNSTDTSDDGKHIGEMYGSNINKSLFIDSETEPSLCKEMRDYFCKSGTKFEEQQEAHLGEEFKHLLLDSASPECICSRGHEKEAAIISSSRAGKGYLPNQTIVGNCKTIENFMDFLIRLRLKLERIKDNTLSAKDFNGLISQLNSIEDRYDSLVSDE